MENPILTGFYLRYFFLIKENVYSLHKREIGESDKEGGIELTLILISSDSNNDFYFIRS